MPVVVLNRSSGVPAIAWNVRLRSDRPSTAEITAVGAMQLLDINDDVLSISVEIEEAGVSQRATVFSGAILAATARGTTSLEVSLSAVSSPWARLMEYRPGSPVQYHGCQMDSHSWQPVCPESVVMALRDVFQRAGVDASVELTDCTLGETVTWSGEPARSVVEGLLAQAGYRATGMHHADCIEEGGRLTVIQRHRVASRVAIPASRLVDRQVTVDWTDWARALRGMPLCVEGSHIPRLVREPDPTRPQCNERLSRNLPGLPEQPPREPLDRGGRESDPPRQPPRADSAPPMSDLPDYESPPANRDCRGFRDETIMTMDIVELKDGSFSSELRWQHFDAGCFLVRETRWLRSYTAKTQRALEEYTRVSLGYNNAGKLVYRYEATDVVIEDRAPGSECPRRVGSRFKVEYWRYAEAEGELYPEWHGIYEYGRDTNELECGDNPIGLRRMEHTSYTRSGKQMIVRRHIVTYDADGNFESTRVTTDVSIGDWVGRERLRGDVERLVDRKLHESDVAEIGRTSGRDLPSVPYAVSPHPLGFPPPWGANPQLRTDPAGRCVAKPPEGYTVVERPLLYGECPTTPEELQLTTRAYYPLVASVTRLREIYDNIREEAQRRVYVMHASLVPTLGLRPGMWITLEGDTHFPGFSWYVTEVAWSWSATGDLRQALTALAWT